MVLLYRQPVCSLLENRESISCLVSLIRWRITSTRITGGDETALLHDIDVGSSAIYESAAALPLL